MITHQKALTDSQIVNRPLPKLQRSPSRFLVVVLSLLSLAMTYPADAQEKVLRTLTVTGEGVDMIPATLTQVQLGVEIQGKTATEVQQELAKRTSAIVEFLRSRKVQQLQTTGIQLQPNYDYSNNQRRLLGYLGSNIVGFRLSTDQIGTLLDEAVKTGATRIDSVSFMATDTEIADAQKRALRQAIVNAQQQAEAVFKALNFTAREIVSIQVNGASAPMPKVLDSAAYARVADAPTTPVIGGEQTVRASVTLQISY